MLREPVVTTGDLNIRLDRPDNPQTFQLLDLVASFGFGVSRRTQTHRPGGMLDVVTSRPDSSGFVASVIYCRVS
jgi:hypothetical protein